MEPARRQSPIADPVPAPKPLKPVIAPPPAPKRRQGWQWAAAFGVLALVGASAWLLTQTTGGGAGTPVAGLRTAVAEQGTLQRTLRVGGTLSAQRFSAIRAPRLSGPRDAGRSSLVLMELASAGTHVGPGDEVARFELRWLEDHIDDVKSRLAQTEATAEKTRSEVLLARETERRDARTAVAELEKAKLDLRTAPVRSEIESKILELTVDEAEAQAEQLQNEYELQEKAHAAEINVSLLGVREEAIHLERHTGDLSEMSIRTRVGGLVVMESIYKGGGSFEQVQTGDQVYPGTLFMRVVDLSQMQLDASVSQTDVQGLRIGQRCTVRLDAYPGLELAGRVKQIGAIAGAGGGGNSRYRRGGTQSYVRSIPVVIRLLEHDERVIPDLSASADVVIAPAEDGIIVPREAVRMDGDQGVVLVRSGNGTTRRSIELGGRNDTHVVVRSGLDKGEEVLLDAPAAVSISSSSD